MIEPTSVTVNGRTYTVNPLNPVEAHAFMHNLIIVRAGGYGIATLGRQILSQCVTPDSKPLDNQANFTAHFNEHPEDMLELESLALDALTAPWEKADSEPAEGDK